MLRYHASHGAIQGQVDEWFKSTGSPVVLSSVCIREIWLHRIRLGLLSPTKCRECPAPDVNELPKLV